MNPGPPPRSPEESRRAGTVLESVEEIRDQIRRTQTVKQSIPIDLGPNKPSTSLFSLPAAAHEIESDPDAETLPYRPSQRPTMALLTVFDDGAKEGETIRIRKETFLIGRSEGDVVISHDNQVSGKHAEISRRFDPKQNRFRWFLRDLNSSNGTFVKVSSSPLAHQQELILGSRRLRFEAATQGRATPIEPAAPGTLKWQRDMMATGAAEPFATLVELCGLGKEKRFPLVQAEYTIGRSQAAASIVIEDPMVSPRHAKLTRDSHGIWNIENAKSLNGLWLRVNEVPLDRGGLFQCGEQRFLMKIL